MKCLLDNRGVGFFRTILMIVEDGVSCWLILDLADGAQRLITDVIGPTPLKLWATSLGPRGKCKFWY